MTKKNAQKYLLNVLEKFYNRMDGNFPEGYDVKWLEAEITAVNELLSSAKQYGDLVGEMQLEHRLEELTLKLESLETDTIDAIAEKLEGRQR